MKHAKVNNLSMTAERTGMGPRETGKGVEASPQREQGRCRCCATGMAGIQGKGFQSQIPIEVYMEFLTYLVDFILHIDAHLFELVEQYGMWIYAILFIIVFCETGLVVTPFLPGDSLLFASGVVAGAGLMGYGHVLLVLLAAGIMGDAVNYFIGRHVGPAIFQRDSRFIKKEHLLKAHHFYEKHGGKAIILARFVPIVRTFAPFVAGIALMCPHRFFLFNITGCVLWVGGLVSAGYFLGNLEWVRQNFSIIVYLIIIISVLPVAIEILRAKLGKKPEHVEELKNPFEKKD